VSILYYFSVLTIYKNDGNLMKKTVRIIDLFAGLGGTRIGFESACKKLKLTTKCVFTSEIKESAVITYKENFSESHIHGDITLINPKEIPDFDYLLAGFPCQPFSAAGNRKGFLDERGGLFFTILEILRNKNPQGFLLENVEGLVNHDSGKTLVTILKKLKDIGYKVTWAVLDSSEFGVPQVRKRIYIVGDKKIAPMLNDHKPFTKTCGDYIEYSVDEANTPFVKLLLKKFSLQSLAGKCIKDKRGGSRNIHSWDIEYKGKVSKEQKLILNSLLKKRRSKDWAIQKGIDWMDGMPLTLDEIKTFYVSETLESDLDDLVKKGYLRFEHPKKKIVVNGISKRTFDETKPAGYNIVTGKLSFPITTIIDPEGFSPTIVATEAGKIAVVTDKSLRKITVTEGLRFSGFPDSYKIDLISYREAFDLIGNTVMPPVIEYVSRKLLSVNN
jgi:DNA (cytosine-5)-methyltransferase 1